MKKIFILLFVLLFVNLFFVSTVSAVGTLTSGAFDALPDEAELVDGYAVYKDGDLFAVDRFPGVGGLFGVICAKGSVVKNNIPNGYISFNEQGKKYYKFTSDDPTVATMTSDVIQCNNIGRTEISFSVPDLVLPSTYQDPTPNLQVIVYDIQTSNPENRQSIVDSIDQAMLAFAGTGDYPSSINEKLAEIISTAFFNGESIPAVLDSKIIIEGDITNDEKEIVEKEMSSADELIGYYNINLRIGADGLLKELTSDIEVEIDIPDNFSITNYGQESFKIIKIHNGRAMTILATLDGGKIKFKTDSFSTYALIYSDSGLATSAPDTGVNTESEEYVSQSNPFIIAMIVLVLFIIIFAHRRLNQNKE